MNLVDVIDIVFLGLVGFSIYRFARKQQQKRKNEQLERDESLTDKRKPS